MDRATGEGFILLADDDPDDRLMIQEAWAEAGIPCRLSFVENGEELLARLRGEGEWAEEAARPPRLIFLDLNMPRMDGWEALEEIKSDPRLHRIPTIVLTTSRSREDVRAAYDLGANSFLCKPAQFDGFVDMLKSVDRYWLQIAELPPVREAA